MSATLSVPLRTPVVVGVKVTLKLQTAPEARLLGQLFVCAKSPLIPMLVMLSVAVPVLLSVTVMGALAVFTA